MIPQEHIDAYQNIFSKRFQGTVILNDPDVGSFDNGFLAIFGLHEEHRIPCMQFTAEELPAILEEMGLPEYGVMRHSLSVTKEHYNDIYDRYFNQISSYTWIECDTLGASQVHADTSMSAPMTYVTQEEPSCVHEIRVSLESDISYGLAKKYNKNDYSYVPFEEQRNDQNVKAYEMAA